MIARIAPIMNMRVIAMSLESPNIVDRLTTQNKWFFAGYMFLALLTAFAGWLVWRSGNKVQDAVRIDADVKISESTKLGNEANERAQKLENDNLILRGQ